MNINCLKNEDVITLELEGRIDVVGAGQLEEAINSHKEQTKKLILDFQNISVSCQRRVEDAEFSAELFRQRRGTVGFC